MAGVVRDIDHDLFDAELALAQSRWPDVRVIVSGLLHQIEANPDPRITVKRDRAENLDRKAQLGLQEQAAAEQAQARFHQFVDRRDEALFLDTTRFAAGLGNSVEATCRAAREGLRIFGAAAAGDEWALSPLPPALSSQERDEVTSGFYQLLLILADAVSQLPGAGPAERANEALRIVNRAEGLLARPTRAFHLRRADFLERKKDSEGASKERAKAERLAPADAFDFFLLGRESTRRSDWPAAIIQLSEATQRQPDHFWAQCLLAICYLQTGQPEAARAGFDSCLQRKRDQPWLYMLRGIATAGIAGKNPGRRGPHPAQEVLAQFENSDADYRKALALLGDKPEHAELHYVVLLNRGMTRLVREDLTAAAADFQQAIRLNPSRFEAFVDLGQVYQRQGRTDDALKQFARAIELRPNYAPLYRGRANVLLGATDLSPELRQMKVSDLEEAIARVSAERRDAASRDLANAIRLESPGEQIIAADWTKQAVLFRASERDDEALAACDAALEIAPRYAPAHEARIKVLLDLKEYDDLIRSCGAVLEWGKPSAKLYELRGMAKNGIEDFSDAIGDFSLALDLSVKADRPRLLRLRGWSNLANEAHRAAVRDFDEAIRLAPADADAYLGRGLAQARLGLYREAESDAKKALEHGDASPRFMCRVAHLLRGPGCGQQRGTEQNSSPTGSSNDIGTARVELIQRAIERTPIAGASGLLPRNDSARPRQEADPQAADRASRG